MAQQQDLPDMSDVFAKGGTSSSALAHPSAHVSGASAGNGAGLAQSVGSAAVDQRPTAAAESGILSGKQEVTGTREFPDAVRFIKYSPDRALYAVIGPVKDVTFGDVKSYNCTIEFVQEDPETGRVQISDILMFSTGMIVYRPDRVDGKYGESYVDFGIDSRSGASVHNSVAAEGIRILEKGAGMIENGVHYYRLDVSGTRADGIGAVVTLPGKAPEFVPLAPAQMLRIVEDSPAGLCCLQYRLKRQVKSGPGPKIPSDIEWNLGVNCTAMAVNKVFPKVRPPNPRRPPQEFIVEAASMPVPAALRRLALAKIGKEDVAGSNQRPAMRTAS